MRSAIVRTCALATLLPLSAAPPLVCAGEPAELAAIDFFERQVRPLLVKKCQRCHGEKKSQGGLRLLSRDAVLTGGDSGPAATILHLMGLDHERLTYRWGGRDYRLTDVAGNVVRQILA